METVKTWLGIAGYSLEAVGALVIVLGAVAASVWFALRIRKVPLGAAYDDFRRALGRVILLGLEFLIAGDIIRTVVVNHTVTSVVVLAVIVMVRAFLSMTIALEVEGRWPWQRR